MRLLLLVISCFIAPVKLHAQSYITKSELQADRKMVLGNWVSEKDTLWRITFYKNGTCRQYYQGKLDETDSYSFSFIAPLCGIKKRTPRTEYLILRNLKDTTDHNCYFVNGVSKKTLSIQWTTNGGPMLFYRP